ncbi:hypothetical protein ACI65C_005090 [Semiaphis heraclei]
MFVITGCWLPCLVKCLYGRLRKKATYEQKELITSFLDEHDGMRTMKFSAEMTYQKYQNLWNELTLQLNRIGPSKNVKDWQKYWNDQRSRVKRKAAEIKNSQQKTGGGIDTHIEPLSIEDENILKLMGGNIVVSGDNEIEEAGLPIFDSNVSCEEFTVVISDIPESTVRQVYNESSIFIVEDQTNTKQTINNKDMVDPAHDQKDAGDQKTPKRKKKKSLDSYPMDKEYLIQFQAENNEIQREIVSTMQHRNTIEQQKVALGEKKLAILLQKNVLDSSN